MQVVHPQPHGEAALTNQSARQAPGNADVAIIIDDVAEDVPGAHGVHATASRKTTKAQRASFVARAPCSVRLDGQAGFHPFPGLNEGRTLTQAFVFSLFARVQSVKLVKMLARYSNE